MNQGPDCKCYLVWVRYHRNSKYYFTCNTRLFKMIVRVLTTCHTQYASFSRCNPMWFLSMGLRQGSGLCSSSSRKYPRNEGCYMLQTFCNELDYHVHVCRIAKGAHI